MAGGADGGTEIVDDGVIATGKTGAGPNAHAVVAGGDRAVVDYGVENAFGQDAVAGGPDRDGVVVRECSDAVQQHADARARLSLAERDCAVVGDRRKEAERLDADGGSRAGYGAVVDNEIIAEAEQLDAGAAGAEIDRSGGRLRYGIGGDTHDRDAGLADGDVADVADDVVVADENSRSGRTGFDLAEIAGGGG